MSNKYVKTLIAVDCMIGLAVPCLNFRTDALSIYNYLIFLMLVFLYSRTRHKRFIPFFVFEFFVFSLILAHRLFPGFLNDEDSFVNTSMIILGILGLSAMLAAAYRIKEKIAEVSIIHILQVNLVAGPKFL